MTLEERAKEFVSKIASGTAQEMDYYANILVEFANETTKELQEDFIKQLAEAREIIKELLSCARNYPEGNLEKCREQNNS